MTNVRAALSQTRLQCAELGTLRDQGWTVDRALSVSKVSKSVPEPRHAVAELLDAAPQQVALAVGRFGDAEVTVQIGPDRVAVIVGTSGAIDPRAFGPLASTARDAWNDDAEAALKLPGQWVVSTQVQLASHLTAADPTIAWVVVPRIDDVTEATSRPPVWQLGPTLDRGRPTIWLIEQLADDERLITGANAIVPLSSDVAVEGAADVLRAARLSRWRKPAQLPDAPHPQAVAPVERHGEQLVPLELSMWRAAATMAWIAMASALVAPTAANSEVELEFFGLQRVTHRIDRTGIDVPLEDERRALEMFSWATSPDGVDQLLAVLQVCSLYRDTPPWGSTKDVFDAARSVFVSLRRDAVAEALNERRAARMVAIDAAQRTTEHVAALSRATVERSVGTLIALAGVIVAQTTSIITDSQAEQLRLLLVVALVALGVWTILVDGPPLNAPLKELRTDLPRIATLLTVAERTEILELSAIKGAERRARMIRWLAPVVFFIAAGAALLVG